MLGCGSRDCEGGGRPGDATLNTNRTRINSTLPAAGLYREATGLCSTWIELERL